MKTITALAHEFVELIPDRLEDGKIYISIPYATVAHRCCCGCGNEVVTPLSPTDWKLIFDGQTISLDPSIGNWSFPCQSHYWIKKNNVKWDQQWSNVKVAAGRAHDQAVKQDYFGTSKPKLEPAAELSSISEKRTRLLDLFRKLKGWK
ncbi:MAG TPA: DUF6527 family protein [Acidobacteriaceae bacterium]